MKFIASSVLSTIIAILALTPQSHAQASSLIALSEKIQATFSGEPPNSPGMLLTGVIAEYKPGASTPPHHHGDAFVLAYVLSGSIVSKIDDGKECVFHVGESFTENPHAHHLVFRNPSKTESTRILAIFLAPKTEKNLVVLDQR